MSDISTDRVTQPVPVEIKNWAPPAKPPYVKNTTVKTYIIDPTKVNGASYVQICEYEPRRLRVAIQVVDVAVVMTLDVPTVSPDTCTATAAPTGGGLYLPPNVAAQPYEFFGPDGMFINSLTAVTRVTVTKEYC
jgi:hypothetical protein